MGFGSLIVSLLIERFQYFYFKASVKKNNFSSIKVFSKLGFIEVNGNSTELIYFEKKQIHDK
jgi:RimJ/RimL family protein N-acetyltransferase